MASDFQEFLDFIKCIIVSLYIATLFFIASFGVICSCLLPWRACELFSPELPHSHGEYMERAVHMVLHTLFEFCCLPFLLFSILIPTRICPVLRETGAKLDCANFDYDLRTYWVKSFCFGLLDIPCVFLLILSCILPWRWGAVMSTVRKALSDPDGYWRLESALQFAYSGVDLFTVPLGLFGLLWPTRSRFTREQFSHLFAKLDDDFYVSSRYDFARHGVMGFFDSWFFLMGVFASLACWRFKQVWSHDWPNDGEFGEWRMAMFSELCYSLIDVITVPMGLIALVWPTRHHYARRAFAHLNDPTDSQDYLSSRFDFARHCVMGFIDTFFILIGVFATLAFWRYKSIWNQGWPEDEKFNMWRMKMVKELLCTFFDILTLPFGMLALCWPSRTKLAMKSLSSLNEPTENENYMKSRTNFVRHFVMGFIDTIFFFFGAIASLFCWRTRVVCSKGWPTDEKFNDWRMHMAIQLLCSLLDLFVIPLAAIAAILPTRGQIVRRVLKEKYAIENFEDFMGSRWSLISHAVGGLIDLVFFAFGLLSLLNIFRMKYVKKALRSTEEDFDSFESAWMWRYELGIQFLYSFLFVLFIPLAFFALILTCLLMDGEDIFDAFECDGCEDIDEVDLVEGENEDSMDFIYNVLIRLVIGVAAIPIILVSLLSLVAFWRFNWNPRSEKFVVKTIRPTQTQRKDMASHVVPWAGNQVQSFGCSFIEIFTVPCLLAVAIPTRTRFTIDHISRECGEDKYQPELRWGRVVNFIGAFFDIPILLLSLLSFAAFWRAPWVVRCMSKVPMAPSLEAFYKDTLNDDVFTTYRKKLLMQIVKSFVDIVMLPVSIIALLLPTNISHMIKEGQDILDKEQEDNLDKDYSWNLRKYCLERFFIGFFDLPFVFITLLACLIFPFRTHKVMRSYYFDLEKHPNLEKPFKNVLISGWRMSVVLELFKSIFDLICLPFAAMFLLICIVNPLRGQHLYLKVKRREREKNAYNVGLRVYMLFGNLVSGIIDLPFWFSGLLSVFTVTRTCPMIQTSKEIYYGSEERTSMVWWDLRLFWVFNLLAGILDVFICVPAAGIAFISGIRTPGMMRDWNRYRSEGADESEPDDPNRKKSWMGRYNYNGQLRLHAVKNGILVFVDVIFIPFLLVIYLTELFTKTAFEKKYRFTDTWALLGDDSLFFTARIELMRSFIWIVIDIVLLPGYAAIYFTRYRQSLMEKCIQENQQVGLRIACLYNTAILFVDFLLLPCIITVYVGRYRRTQITDKWDIETVSNGERWSAILLNFGVMVIDFLLLPCYALIFVTRYRQPMLYKSKEDNVWLLERFSGDRWAAALKNAFVVLVDGLLLPCYALILMTRYRQPMLYKSKEDNKWLLERSSGERWVAALKNSFVVIVDSLLIPLYGLVWITRYRQCRLVSETHNVWNLEESSGDRWCMILKNAGVVVIDTLLLPIYGLIKITSYRQGVMYKSEEENVWLLENSSGMRWFAALQNTGVILIDFLLIPSFALALFTRYRSESLAGSFDIAKSSGARWLMAFKNVAVILLDFILIPLYTLIFVTCYLRYSMEGKWAYENSVTERWCLALQNSGVILVDGLCLPCYGIIKISSYRNFAMEQAWDHDKSAFRRWESGLKNTGIVLLDFILLPIYGIIRCTSYRTHTMEKSWENDTNVLDRWFLALKNAGIILVDFLLLPFYALTFISQYRRFTVKEVYEPEKDVRLRWHWAIRNFAVILVDFLLIIVYAVIFITCYRRKLMQHAWSEETAAPTRWLLALQNFCTIVIDGLMLPFYLILLIWDLAVYQKSRTRERFTAGSSSCERWILTFSDALILLIDILLLPVYLIVYGTIYLTSTMQYAWKESANPFQRWSRALQCFAIILGDIILSPLFLILKISHRSAFLNSVWEVKTLNAADEELPEIRMDDIDIQPSAPDAPPDPSAPQHEPPSYDCLGFNNSNGHLSDPEPSFHLGDSFTENPQVDNLSPEKISQRSDENSMSIFDEFREPSASHTYEIAAPTAPPQVNAPDYDQSNPAIIYGDDRSNADVIPNVSLENMCTESVIEHGQHEVIVMVDDVDVKEVSKSEGVNSNSGELCSSAANRWALTLKNSLLLLIDILLLPVFICLYFTGRKTEIANSVKSEPNEFSYRGGVLFDGIWLVIDFILLCIGFIAVITCYRLKFIQKAYHETTAITNKVRLELLFNSFLVIVDLILIVPILFTWIFRYRWESSILTKEGATRYEDLKARGTVLKNAGVQLIDFLLLPFGLVCLVSHRRLFVKNPFDEKGMVTEVRLEILFNFMVIVLDVILCIPIFIVFLCRYRWNFSLREPDATWGRHLQIRAMIVQSLFIQLLDFCLLPLVIFVFCTRYRWRTVVAAEEDKKAWWDSTAARVSIVTTFVSVFVDLPFFVIALFGIALIWRADLFIRQISNLSVNENDWETRKGICQLMMKTIRDFLCFPFVLLTLVSPMRFIQIYRTFRQRSLKYKRGDDDIKPLYSAEKVFFKVPKVQGKPQLIMLLKPAENVHFQDVDFSKLKVFATGQLLWNRIEKTRYWLSKFSQPYNFNGHYLNVTDKGEKGVEIRLLNTVPMKNKDGLSMLEYLGDKDVLFQVENRESVICRFHFNLGELKAAYAEDKYSRKASINPQTNDATLNYLASAKFASGRDSLWALTINGLIGCVIDLFWLVVTLFGIVILCFVPWRFATCVYILFESASRYDSRVSRMLMDLLEECKLNMDSFTKNAIPWYNEHSKFEYHNIEMKYDPSSKYENPNEHMRGLKTRFLGVWNAIAVQVMHFIDNFDGDLETFNTMEAILHLQQEQIRPTIYRYELLQNHLQKNLNLQTHAVALSNVNKMEEEHKALQDDLWQHLRVQQQQIVDSSSKRCCHRIGPWNKEGAQIRQNVWLHVIEALKDLMYLSLLILLILTFYRIPMMLNDLHKRKLNMIKVFSRGGKAVIWIHIIQVWYDSWVFAEIVLNSILVITTLVNMVPYISEIPQARSFADLLAVSREYRNDIPYSLYKLFVFLTLWETYKFFISSVVVGLILPAVLFIELFRKLLGCFPKLIPQILSIAAWGGALAFPFYYFTRIIPEMSDEGFTESESNLIDGRITLFLFMIGLCCILSFLSRFFNGELRHIHKSEWTSPVIRPTWLNFLAICTIFTEAAQIAALGIWLAGKTAYDTSDWHWLVDFAGYWLFIGNEGDSTYQIWTSLSIVLVIIWYTITSFPMVVEGIWAWRENGSFRINSGWRKLNWFLWTVVFCSILINLIKPLQCRYHLESERNVVFTDPSVSCFGNSWSTNSFPFFALMGLVIYIITTQIAVHSRSLEDLQADTGVVDFKLDIRYPPLYVIGFQILRYIQIISGMLLFDYPSTAIKVLGSLEVFHIIWTAVYRTLHDHTVCCVPHIIPVRIGASVATLAALVVAYADVSAIGVIENPVIILALALVVIIIATAFATRLYWRHAQKKREALLRESGCMEIIQSILDVEKKLTIKSSFGKWFDGNKEQWRLELERARSPLQIAKLMLEFEQHILAERLKPNFLTNRPSFLNRLRKVGIEFEDVREIAEDLRDSLVFDLADFQGIHNAVDKSYYGDYLSPTSVGIILEFCMNVGPLNDIISPILMVCPRAIRSMSKKELLKYQQDIAAEQIEKFVNLYPPLEQLRMDVHKKHPLLDNIKIAADEGDFLNRDQKIGAKAIGFVQQFTDMIFGTEAQRIDMDDCDETEASENLEFKEHDVELTPAEQDLSHVDKLFLFHQYRTLFNLFRAGETEFVFTPEGRIMTSVAAGDLKLPHVRPVNVGNLARIIERCRADLKEVDL